MFLHRAELARALTAVEAAWLLLLVRGVVDPAATLRSAAGLAIAALLVIAWYGAGAMILRVVAAVVTPSRNPSAVAAPARPLPALRGGERARRAGDGAGAGASQPGRPLT